MDRGVALLGLAAGGAVMTALVRPGEHPQLGWPERKPFGCAADLVEVLRQAWRSAGSPPLVGAALAAEGESSPSRFTFSDPRVGPPLEHSAIMRALETSRVHVLRASLASARAAPRMLESDRLTLCAGTPTPGAIGVIAPETRLTASAALPDSRGEWMPFHSEAGRLPVTPHNSREARVLESLKAAGLRNADHILSRTGLVAIHAALAAIEGEPPPGHLSWTDVTDMAGRGDRGSIEAVELMCGWIGDLIRQFAITLNLGGGVYVAGRLIHALRETADLANFEHRFRRPDLGESFLAAVPIWCATGSAALYGLSTLFSASDARMNAGGVLLLDC